MTSTEGTTSLVFSSVVLGVPARIVAPKLQNIMSVKDYTVFADSPISCAVAEDTTPPTAVGSTRRCTLHYEPYSDTVLRERLIATSQDAEHFRTVVTLGYVPCNVADRHRSPFGLDGYEALQEAHTTYTVSVVSANPDRCYVEARTQLTLLNSAAPTSMPATLEAIALHRRVVAFWQSYLDRSLHALAEQVRREAHPSVDSRVEAEFREAYRAMEDRFCNWAGSAAQTFPREAVLGAMEEMLVFWTRLMHDYRQQKLVADGLLADMDGVKQMASVATQQLAQCCACKAMVELQRGEATVPAVEVTPEQHGAVTAAGATPSSAKEKAQGQGQESSAPAVREAEGTTGSSSSLPPPPPSRPVVVKTSTGAEKRTQLPPPQSSPSPSVAAAAVPSPKPNGFTEPPVPYPAHRLRSLFTTVGSLDESEAAVLFAALHGDTRGYVTASEIQQVLSCMDHCGLYEDCDGTMETAERSRAKLRSSERNGSHSAADRTNAATPPTTEPAPSAQQEVVMQAEATTQQTRKTSAMERLATATVSRFAFHERGKLHFDEFCLALLHLLKP